MVPRIEDLQPTKLIGMKVNMSFAEDQTHALWKNFSPRRKEIKHVANSDLYSVGIYPDTDFFANFNPLGKFEKWAAVAVSEFAELPDGMDKLIIPSGQYAIFSYRGKPSEAEETFRYIYGTWISNSGYEIDDRPHFALMGEKYKGEDPESEEEFWVPVKVRE